LRDRVQPVRLFDALHRALAAILERHARRFRASPRTTSDTRTSPGDEAPQMREAMFTAPP
jgi:hypothetical protein